MRVSEALKVLDTIKDTLGDIEIEGLRDIITKQKQVKRMVGGIVVDYVIELKITNAPKKQQWERE